VNIISISSVVKAIKKNILNNSIWPDFTVIPDIHHGIVSFIKLKNGQPVKIDNLSITPYKVHHSVPAVGYLIEDRRGRALFYSGDTGPTSSTWRQLKDKRLNGLIIEASFPNELEEIALKSGHLTPNLLKKELSKMGSLPERIYVTHLKPQYFKTIRLQLRKLGFKNLKLLKDGETVKIG
jgi:cAMP phosphodiesterase